MESPLYTVLGLLMLAREYTMDTCRSVLASNRLVVGADRLSKLKGALFMIAMLGFIWNRATMAKHDMDIAMSAIAISGMIIAFLGLARFICKYTYRMST